MGVKNIVKGGAASGETTGTATTGATTATSGAMTEKKAGVGEEAGNTKERTMPEDHDDHRNPVQEALRLAAEVVHEQQETIDKLIRCLCRICKCRCHDDDDDRGDRDRRRDRD